jgi:hypothetical protein
MLTGWCLVRLTGCPPTCFTAPPGKFSNGFRCLGVPVSAKPLPVSQGRQHDQTRAASIAFDPDFKSCRIAGEASGIDPEIASGSDRIKPGQACVFCLGCTRFMAPNTVRAARRMAPDQLLLYIVAKSFGEDSEPGR